MISGGPAAVLILDLTSVDKVASFKSYEVERVHDKKDIVIVAYVRHVHYADGKVHSVISFRNFGELIYFI